MEVRLDEMLAPSWHLQFILHPHFILVSRLLFAPCWLVFFRERDRINSYIKNIYAFPKNCNFLFVTIRREEDVGGILCMSEKKLLARLTRQSWVVRHNRADDAQKGRLSSIRRRHWICNLRDDNGAQHLP